MCVQDGVRGGAPAGCGAEPAKNFFCVFWGSRGHFCEKTALPVWQPQTAKLGHFLLNILSLTQKSVQTALYISSTSLFNGGIITASQQATFYGGSAPHIGQNVPKWGFKLGLEPIFFAAWRGPTRERMVRSTPPPRSGAEGKFFTPKAYLHTSFCVQKMGDPELCFRLHRVLFCVRHKSTLPPAPPTCSSRPINPP